jgi:hypothetical protein
MENYGFVVVSNEEAKRMDLPNGSGLFSELYKHMENEIKRNPKKEVDYGTALRITTEERRISFMNRYFVFKKVRSVDAKKMSEVILKQNLVSDEREEEAMKELIGDIKGAEEKGVGVGVAVEEPLIIAKKNKKPKMVLKAFQPVIEEPTITEESKQPETEQTITKPKRKLVIKE